MVQSEKTKLKKARAIRRSHSAWAANCVVVMKEDGTAKVCQDFRVRKSSTISHSGGLGNIDSIFDGMRGSTCFTSINLATGFTQLETAEEDKHKTTRRAWGAVGIQPVWFRAEDHPVSIFEAYVVEAQGPLKVKGVDTVVDDIIIHTKSVDGHVELLEKVLERLQRFGLSVNLPKSIWCWPQQEFVGMAVSRLGVQLSEIKIEAVAELS